MLKFFGTKKQAPSEIRPEQGIDAIRMRAEELYDQGLNCAEVLVKIFTERSGFESIDSGTLQYIATGFGKGMGRTLGTCGALSAAIMVINAAIAPRLDKPKKIYKTAGAFTQKFHDHFGAALCGDLRRDPEIDCKTITVETAVLLGEFLEDRGAA